MIPVVEIHNSTCGEPQMENDMWIFITDFGITKIHYGYPPLQLWIITSTNQYVDIHISNTFVDLYRTIVEIQKYNR